MPDRFITEYGLNMAMSYFVLLQDDRLRELDDLLPPGAPKCHIYAIGVRPRITIAPGKTECGDDFIDFELVMHDKDERICFPVKMKQPSSGRISRIESLWPHNSVKLFSGDEVLLDTKVALLAARVPELQGVLDLEVLYVGQSFGSEGDREASDRLQSHATLQKILSETSRLQPDREVWLAMFRFDESTIVSFDGTLGGRPGAMEADEGRIEKMLSIQMSEQQKINFTEAALIRYFDPRFNEVFRKSFPSPAHKTYAECYALDLNMISVEIDSEEMQLRLYSVARPRSWVHFAHFPLHDPKERRYMLDLLTPGER